MYVCKDLQNKSKISLVLRPSDDPRVELRKKRVLSFDSLTAA
jgi:hypothetical protein